MKLLTHEEEKEVLKRVLAAQNPKDTREEYKEIVGGKLFFRHNV